jgi:hypothetical protein
VSDDLRAGTRAPRTLLELLIKQGEATYEEQAAAFEKAARELGEPATMSVRHLQRLAAGQRTGHATPTTRRVLRQLYGHGIDELLGPPPANGSPVLAVVPELRPAAPTLPASLDLPPDEATEVAALAGHLVDLSVTIDLQIAVDGLCSVTYRYRALNLTDRPLHRTPRDLWFQHSRGKLELFALRESTTRNAIQRLHTADNVAKFACQLSPPIQPGETASFGYRCSGAEFRGDWYWRQQFARYTRAYTLNVRHEGIKEVAGITATEELPDGTETLAQESISWDYDGDDVIMKLTRHSLEPNQYATLRWEHV